MDVRTKLLLLALICTVARTMGTSFATESCSGGIVTEFTAFGANSTYFDTPRYPERYTKNFRCGVLITAEQANGVVKIQVYNSTFQSPCADNNIKVYDGLTPSASLLAQWCVSSVSAVTSTGQHLFFLFTADSNVTDEGAVIEFTSGTLNPLPTTLAPTTPSTTVAPTTTTESSSAGAIAGGVVGGLVGVAALVCGILAIVYFVKKKKGRVSSKDKVSESKPTKTPVKEIKDKQKDKEADEKATAVPFGGRPVSRGKSSMAFREASNLSRVGTPLDRKSTRTSDSLRDSPLPITPAYSATPPRTPKGSIRHIESRLRLSSEMGSPATPPPSHREAVRSSTITIASVRSTPLNRSVALDGAEQSPVIMEEIP